MFRSWFVFLALPLLIMLASASPALAQDDAVGLLDRFVQAVNDRNLSAAVDLFNKGPEVTLAVGCKPKRGIQAITEQLQSMEDAQSEEHMVVSDVAVSELGDSHKLLAASFATEDGATREAGIMTLVLVKKAKWEILYLHAHAYSAGACDAAG